MKFHGHTYFVTYVNRLISFSVIPKLNTVLPFEKTILAVEANSETETRAEDQIGWPDDSRHSAFRERPEQKEKNTQLNHVSNGF